jgi:hypothetical protein
MANDLDDLDETERGPQPPQGRELVIVDLRHPTIMPPSWPGHRPAGVRLPINHRGPQQPDQLPQAVFKAEAIGRQGQQQAT